MAGVALKRQKTIKGGASSDHIFKDKIQSALFFWPCSQLWCRPAAAAPIRPLAWEPPYGAGTAVKRKQNKMTEMFCFIYKTERDSDMENRLVVAKGEGEGWTRNVGLVDANYCI